jgi:hypothetical protein
MDAVVNNIDSAPSLLRNMTKDLGHWIAFRLVGGPKSPRDAIGSTVYVTASHTRQRRDVFAGGSFASSSDPRPHFGLGTATSVDSVEVHWPDAKVEHFVVHGCDKIVTLTEGTGDTGAPAAGQGGAQ